MLRQSLAFLCQKRPITVSKETYYSVKRDLDRRLSDSVILLLYASRPRRCAQRRLSIFVYKKKPFKKNIEPAASVRATLPINFVFWTTAYSQYKVTYIVTLCNIRDFWRICCLSRLASTPVLPCTVHKAGGKTTFIHTFHGINIYLKKKIAELGATRPIHTSDSVSI